MGDRLGIDVECVEYCVAVHPGPLGEHINRIDHCRPERGKFALDAGRQRCRSSGSRRGRAWSTSAGVTEGDRILVHGGGGGAGHVALQIAKAFGAHVITTTSGSKREFIEGLGADKVIDHTTVNFTEAVRGIDLVLDTISGDTARRSLAALHPGGHLVTAVADEGAQPTATYEAAGLRFSGIAVDPAPVALRDLVELLEQGRLRVHVQETFPLERVADARRLLDAGHLQGKLVLTV